MSADQLELLPVALVILEPSGRISRWNHRFNELLADGTKDLLGRNLGEFIEESAIEKFLEGMAALKRGERESFNLNCRCKKPDGLVWVHASLKRLMAGGSAEVVAVLDDISGLMDEQLRLQREKELAEEATRSKSSFLANMSHEIRTPIHTITGTTELLLDTLLDKEQQEYVAQVQFSAEVLLGLVNDILDFSKIEAGRLEIEKISFSLSKMIEDAVDMQSLIAFKKGLEIVLFVDQHFPRIVAGDPVRIRQVITNFLSNAIKFTAHGEIVVRSEAKSTTDDTLVLRVEVHDSGIGIPREKQALLFEAFRQLDASTSRRYGGTGLGLSICNSLVRMMGGVLGVNSVSGSGSTFWFEIPLPVRRDTELPAELEVLPERSDLRVLILDDNAASREVCRQILEPFCSHLGEADASERALEMLRAASEAGNPYEIVFVDLVLPGMDGWQFASEVHSDERISPARLFLMSPPGSMGGEAKMKLLNWFEGYLSKPIKARDLLEALSRLEAMTESGTSGTESGTADAVGPVAVREPAASLDDSGSFDATILVAEDHLVNQKLFETILSKLGCRVLLAENGKQALAIVKSSRVDLVFMDVNMPEMNGYEATQAIRGLGISIPIIAVTASVLKGDQDKCFQAGMDNYLPKPFHRKDVEGILLRYVGHTAPVDKIPADAEIMEIAALEDDADARQPAEAAQEKSLFDYGFGLNAFMGQTEIYHQVLRDYIPRTDKHIHELLHGECDAERMQHIGHTLKGSGLNLGLATLGEAAMALETGSRDEPEADQSARVDTLSAVWKRSRIAILKALENRET